MSEDGLQYPNPGSEIVKINQNKHMLHPGAREEGMPRSTEVSQTVNKDAMCIACHTWRITAQ